MCECFHEFQVGISKFFSRGAKNLKTLILHGTRQKRIVRGCILLRLYHLELDSAQKCVCDKCNNKIIQLPGVPNIVTVRCRCEADTTSNKFFLTPFYRLHFSKFYTSKKFLVVPFPALPVLHFEKSFSRKGWAHFTSKNRFEKRVFSGFTSDCTFEPSSFHLKPSARRKSTRAFYSLTSRNYVPVYTFSIVY